MQFIIMLLHVLVCVSLIALVLVQHGKGADIGAAFGAGASNTVFGSSGASSFLMKLTGALAAIFFFTSLFLGYMDSHAVHSNQFQLPVGSKSIVIPGENMTPPSTTANDNNKPTETNDTSDVSKGSPKR